MKIAPKNIRIAFLLVICAIGTEYFARDFALLLISSAFGLYFIVSRDNVRKKDMGIFFLILVVHFGVIASKLFYSKDVSKLVDIVFLIQLFVFSIFTILFFKKFMIPKSFLLISSLFYLPHFLGLILGLTVMAPAQFGVLVFGGLHSDPNYLSPDLLFAFSSQLFIFYLHFKIRTKILNGVNLILTGYLLLLTGSRTAMLSVLLIILLFALLRIVAQKGLIKKLALPILVSLIVLLFGGTILQSNNRISYIYDRFTKSGPGSDMIENERYYVWGISYEVINSGELFEGYGVDEFLTKQYRFVSHNVFLDVGIKYGKYTFYSHVIFVLVALLLFISRFIRRKFKLGMNVPSYMLVFVTSQLLMMNSISVSQKHIYWFLLVVLISFGFVKHSKDLEEFSN